MQNIGFDEKNPTVYEDITELDNPCSKNAGGATFNDFCQAFNYRVPDKEKTEDLRKVFIFIYKIKILNKINII